MYSLLDKLASYAYDNNGATLELKPMVDGWWIASLGDLTVTGENAPDTLVALSILLESEGH